MRNIVEERKGRVENEKDSATAGKRWNREDRGQEMEKTRKTGGKEKTRKSCRKVERDDEGSERE